MHWYRLMLGAVVLLGALTGLVDNGTVASFQSLGTASANVFSTGTVDIANAPSSALMSVSHMVPGEKVYATLTVTNSGTLPLRYAVASTVTNTDAKGLGPQLDLTIAYAPAACSDAGFATSIGSVLYGQASPLGSLGGALNLVGTPSAYPNGGRTLSAASSETLCFQVALPSDTSSAYQGATTTATFTFSAQQL